MPSAKLPAAPFDAATSLVNAYAINCRISEYLIQNLDAAAWRAPTPDGKGRTIAAIFAHIHNVRLMWLKAAGYRGAMPEKLDGESCTPKSAGVALTKSGAALGEMIGSALASDGKIKGFKPDVCAFAGYLIGHDAHHRGQISLLARQIGKPIPKSANFGMWEWGTR